MRVEVWSDVVCPWCHVGKARFEEAVRRLGWEDDVDVVFRPFELDPRVPPGGMPAAEYYRQKFGGGPGANPIAAVEGRIGEAAAELGLRFDWERARRVRTFDAHRLLTWALDTAGSAPQRELKRRLMEAYFAEGRDVADHDELSTIAAEAGLDADAARAMLTSDDYVDVVVAAQHDARERGIHAVPTFVIEDRIAVPGAQDPETFVTILARARERFVDADADAGTE